MLYLNQSIDLQIDWLLYERNIDLIWVKEQ